MLVNSKYNKFLSTINFILCFVGYEFVTTIFLPSTSDVESVSRSVTIPYRLFALFISILVVLINLKAKPRIGFGGKLLIVFWVILLLRMFFDLHIRTDVYVDISQIIMIWIFALCICLGAIYSVIKSYKNIDVKLALKFIYVALNLIMIFSLFSNNTLSFKNEELVRASGNIALNTISFGRLAVMDILLSFFLLTRMKNKFIYFLTCCSSLLGLYIMLQAASRGPFLALILCLFFYFFVKIKHKIRGLFLILFIAFFLYTNFNSIFNIIGDISPMMKYRIETTMAEGDQNRYESFNYAINAFLEHPLLGSGFGIFKGGGVGYSHNMILDSLMMGIVPGIIFISLLVSALFVSYKLLKRNDSNFWIALILLQNIVAGFSSGAFYTSPLLSVMLIFVFMYNNKTVLVNNKEI